MTKMHILNRAAKKRHPLYKPLKMMARNIDQCHAIACNFMHEPRVSKAREMFFLAMLGKSRNPLEFAKHLGQYGRDHVQQTPSPDFENSYNQHNRIPNPAEPLVSIFIVNGLSQMFLWAREFPKTKLSKLRPKQRRAFHLFANYLNRAEPRPPDSLDFVHEAMRDRRKQRQFFDVVCTLYEIYRVNHPYHPIWLTKWADFRAHWNSKTLDRANRWCHWVGIPTERKEGQWVIVLRFRAQQLRKRFYHPTVLEAGVNPYHFPAPEGVLGGGRAADLRNGSVTLACEYITQWPALRLAQINFAKGCAQLQPLPQKTIRQVRRHHMHRLRVEFRPLPEASSWLKRVGSF